MRIVYLHQYFHTPDEVGGTRSYEMARRFVAAGHDVHVVTSDQRGGARTWRTDQVAGITVHYLPVAYSNDMSFRQRVGAFTTFARRAGRHAARLRPDVVFATSTPLTIAIPAAWVKFRRRVPVVFEVRDLWPEMPIAVGALSNPVLRWAARRLERFAYRISTRVVALSPGMADGVVRTGYPRSAVTVVPNSCDLELFDVPLDEGRAYRATIPGLGDEALVVYCGTLGRVNRVEWLAELAAAAQGETAAHFLVVGRGAEHDRIRARAAELGVLDRTFHLREPVAKSDVPRVLSAATVTCSLFAPIPEMEVNSANKFFDGLAAGRPVLINYGGWQADVLQRSGAGLVVPAGDLTEAVRLLVEALDDVDGLARMRQAARTVAQDSFDRDLLAHRLLAVIVDAVDRP